MPQQVVAPRFEETRIAGAASGVSLTTAAAFTAMVPGSNYMALSPRNFSTAVVARWRLCPYLTVLKNQDLFVTEPIDASLLLQDGDTTVTLVMNSFDTLANGDALYIGSREPISGLFVNVVNANGTSNSIAVKYWNGSLVAPANVTDNTASGGASFAVDGTITWTVPLDWVAETFTKVFQPNQVGGAWYPDSGNPIYNDPMFWCRLDWSVAMDSSTSISEMFGRNRSTAYVELNPGQLYEQTVRAKPGEGGYAAVEALTDAGSANLIITNGCYGKFGTVAQVAL